ncbi:hypothetical protein [Streptomyces noursei]|uniref:hypothetical protein n=1 Tax=Streptomyces noursei TaxID=1971 RepID=UPI001678AFD7|nr:hypothetical protein [Streptomyces noursei]MCZ1013847.1 hypothetical protein [Streptomyces noursei]GGX33700.1 hypothetical protein GCM10010341_63990 [Streptomyces noursei]
MRRLARTLGVLGGSVLLTLGLTRPANAATGWIHVNGYGIHNPSTGLCINPQFPTGHTSVANGTDSMALVYNCPGCCGPVVSILPPLTSDVAENGFGVFVTSPVGT